MKTTEFNLSDKITDFDMDSCDGILVEDVKEFIRLLEYELISEFGGDDGLSFVQDKLRKLAGDKLIWTLERI